MRGYAALKLNIGIRWYNERYASLCHKGRQVVTWSITSYGGAGGKLNTLPRARRSIDLARKTHFTSTLKLKNPPIDLFFWTSVTLSVWPSDDNHYTFPIFTNLASENIRSCWYSRGSKYVTEIYFFPYYYQPFVFHRKVNGRPKNKMKKIKR